MAKVIVEPFEKVSLGIIKQFYNLTNPLHEGSRMHYCLNNLLDFASNPKVTNVTVFYILENDKVISWGMVHNKRCASYVKDTDTLRWRTRKKLLVDIFTDKKHRMQGYASMICDAMQQTFSSRQLYGGTDFTSIYVRHGIKNGY